jgi:hypothetical protein
MGGAGRSEDERERSTWLAVDPDIWGADDEQWAPPVIEGSEPARPIEGPLGRVNQVEQPLASNAEQPEASGEDDELDLVLAELEAELERELEMAGLLEEGHSADGQENPALDDGPNGLLGRLPHHDTGLGGNPQATK